MSEAQLKMGRPQDVGTNPGDPLPMLEGHVSHGRFERVLKARQGYSPILQISCRDRNRIAIQGDTLGASALGVCNALCLSGDDVGAGDHPEAKPVFDLDSISLTRTLRILRDESRFLSGRKLDLAPKLFVGNSELDA